MNVPSAPARLQFRLRGFNENESTDDFLQGANDEVWMSAAGLDSSSVKVGPDHQPVADIVRTQPLGDVSDDAVRGPWKTQPHVLMEFDLRQPGDFPRTYTVTLFIVEHDNGDLQKAFEELEQRVGPQIKAAAVAAAVAAGTAVGAAVGSAVPGIGTAVGAAVGALAGLAYDGVVKAIDDGLADDVFTPIPVTLTVGNLSLLGQQPGVGTEQSLKVREHGADYDVIYDWNVVLAPADQPMPAAPSDVVQALAAMGVDFSVPETDLRGWLANPDFTPYPAIAQALLGWGRRLKAPVFLDVIVWNYEHTPGVTSPRAVADVQPAILQAAVLEGSNERHGTQAHAIEQLFTP
ncbi:hypothetical protein [Streptomyces fungicidicus]|uniref:hypothetical protein n=1 Tax=Streptomyces fungicidicus TaxID=68203 RepID=UPI0036A19A3E